MRILFLTILILSLVGSNLADLCGECWTKCFPQPMSCDQADFYNLIRKIQGTRIGLEIKGTAFLMDGSSKKPALWNFQLLLATLVAMTEPVANECPGKCCNPFFLNVYMDHFAYYIWDWQCQNRCTVADTILRLPQLPQSGQNWASGGCILADHAMLRTNQHSCSGGVDPDKRMAIAFMNNDLQTDELDTSCDKIPYRAAIRIGNPFPATSYMPFAQEGVHPPLPPAHPSSLNFLESYSKSKEAVLENLVRCVSNSCCQEDSLAAKLLYIGANQTAPLQISYVSKDNTTVIDREFSNIPDFLAFIDYDQVEQQPPL